jgi:hypothetical protein
MNAGAIAVEKNVDDEIADRACEEIKVFRAGVIAELMGLIPRKAANNAPVGEI